MSTPSVRLLLLVVAAVVWCRVHSITNTGSDVLDYLGITILLAWLFVRLLVLALPMVIVMHAMSGNHGQAPQPTEDGHVYLLLSLEAGLYGREDGGR